MQILFNTMNQPIIEIKNIGKKYNINHHRGGYVALRDVLTNIAKNPFKFLKKKAKNVMGIDTKEEFWALRNVSLEINKGDIIGIIGHNGAGKSTLLKILTGITPPSEGEIIMHGRIASLLEVGTGFHPELTGRENIFLNGAILGMTKKEIVLKFDEIVTFAGINKFLDTPVKYYSSGMYVRLAFSVAAHMEPDILLVDEVLAVGDAEFQKKCLGKMEEVTKRKGRTILFVSHNMVAVEKICTKTLWLENGQIKSFGDTPATIEEYLRAVDGSQKNNVKIIPDYKKEVTFTRIWATNPDGIVTNSINVDQDITIWLEFEVTRPINAVEISICLTNTNNVNVIFISLSDSFNRQMLKLNKGTYTTSTTIKKNFLMPDNYMIRISAHEMGLRDIDLYANIMRLNIIENDSTMANYGPGGRHWSTVLSDAKWVIKKNNDVL